MGARLVCPKSALAAAGIVGQWEVDGKAETMSHDRSASLYLFGDETLDGVRIPLSRIFEMVNAEDRALAMDDCTRAMTRGGPAAVEVRVSTAAAGERVLQVRGYFAWDEDGRMMGRGVFIDVTDFQPLSGSRQAAAAPTRPRTRSSDPLAEAAEHGIEVRMALGRSGHGALRLAADLLLFEINTALAARLTISDKAVPGVSEPFR